MQFPVRIGKRWQIQIPKTVREFLDLKEGDHVIMEIHKKDDIDSLKKAIEKPYRRE